MARPAEFDLRRSRGALPATTSPPASDYLTAGHSYEICLTNKLVAEATPDPLELYRALRRVNPAPFAAYLRFGDVAVLSSSPERFLSVDRDALGGSAADQGHQPPRRDAGGRRRAWPQRLRADEKSRAENVTIVDLLRNDLGRVCEVGTVTCPS